MAFVASVLGSGEYYAAHGSSVAGFITGLYEDLLGRTASPGEILGWQGVLATGQSRTAVAFDILSSSEALRRQNTATGWLNDLLEEENAWVGQVYEDVLRRRASRSETMRWARQLANGLSRHQVVERITNATCTGSTWAATPTAGGCRTGCG
jgi:hypothetical protein